MNVRFKHTIIFSTMAIALAILASCGSRGEGKTVPITTKSEEALAFFLEGRDLSENLRINESQLLFELALEEDPQFAMAHLFRSFTPNSPADFRKHLRRAEKHAVRASKGERLFIDISIMASNGDTEGQFKVLEKLLDLYPRDKRILTRMGQAYQFGPIDYTAAIKYYKKAISLDSDFAPPYNLMGYAYAAIDENGKAEKALKNYARLLPNDPNPYDSMGDLFTGMGRLDDANANYQKAFDLNPAFTISQLNYARNLTLQGKFDEARAAIQIAIDSEQNERTRSFYSIAIPRTYVYEGRFDDALEQLTVVSDQMVADNLPFLNLNILGYKFMIHFAAGDVAGMKVNHAMAMSFVEAGEYEVSEAIQAQIREAMESNEIVLAVIDGHYDAARELLAAYLVLSEAAVPGYNKGDYGTMFAFLEMEMGNIEQAIEYLKPSPNQTLDLYRLGKAYETMGEIKKAKRAYQEHAELYARDAWYSITLRLSREALARL